MPKIQWTGLPRALRDHLFERLRAERNLAERVGFVPVVRSPINDLGPIGGPQTAKRTPLKS